MRDWASFAELTELPEMDVLNATRLTCFGVKGTASIAACQPEWLPAAWDEDARDRPTRERVSRWVTCAQVGIEP